MQFRSWVDMLRSCIDSHNIVGWNSFIACKCYTWFVVILIMIIITILRRLLYIWFHKFFRHKLFHKLVNFEALFSVFVFWIRAESVMNQSVNQSQSISIIKLYILYSFILLSATELMYIKLYLERELCNYFETVGYGSSSWIHPR